MQLHITSKAMENLQELMDDEYNYLLLYYDIDGCGCGVNGIPTVRLTNKKDDFQTEIQSNAINTIISEQQAIFFAEDMKLDFINGYFRLSSPGEILNPNISKQSLTNVNMQ